MPQLFSALRVLSRHTVMKSALVPVYGLYPDLQRLTVGAFRLSSAAGELHRRIDARPIWRLGISCPIQARVVPDGFE